MSVLGHPATFIGLFGREKCYCFHCFPGSLAKIALFSRVFVQISYT